MLQAIGIGQHERSSQRAAGERCSDGGSSISSTPKLASAVGSGAAPNHSAWRQLCPCSRRSHGCSSSAKSGEHSPDDVHEEALRRRRRVVARRYRQGQRHRSAHEQTGLHQAGGAEAVRSPVDLRVTAPVEAERPPGPMHRRAPRATAAARSGDSPTNRPGAWLRGPSSAARAPAAAIAGARAPRCGSRTAGSRSAVRTTGNPAAGSSPIRPSARLRDHGRLRAAPTSRAH